MEWLINIMMVCFTSAMLVMIVDSMYIRFKKWRLTILSLISLVSLLSCLVLLLMNWAPLRGGYLSIRPLESALSTLYMIDSAGLVLTLLVLLISLFVVLYSKFYISQTDNVGPYFSLIILFVVSMIGVVVAGDLLALFLFWEAMSICAYGLASFNKEDQLSLESTIKYLVIAGTGSLTALLGIGLIYNETRSILISDLARINLGVLSIGQLGLLILIVGLGVEAAVFPLHTWLPDVYSSAHPSVTSLFVGATKATSFYAIIKILQRVTLPEVSITQLSLILGVLSLLTMVIGNFSALYQLNIRRLFAYSSIAHAGYLLASLSTLTSLGFIAGIFHLWNYGIVKSALFMLVGIINKKYDEADLNTLVGVGRKDKVVGALFAALSLAMMGSPPFGLFWSELIIINSLINSKSILGMVLAVGVVLNILVSIGYYYRVINTISLGPGGSGRVTYDRMMLLPIILLTTISLATGVAPWIIMERIV
jgi:proton-translocating NADH-quinone oxidoreductase chain N